MIVKAKIDAGVPAKKGFIRPVAGRDNEKVWPAFKGGRLVHGGPLIVVGEQYEIPDGTELPTPGLGEIFELTTNKAKKNEGKADA